MGGGRVWGCVRTMISADQATLSLIGTAETLGCLPPHSNEKPWPPLVSKVTKAYFNCTFSNGVSHARTPTPVMTITIMSLGSTGTFQSSVTLGEEMLVNYCYKFKGCCIIFDCDTGICWSTTMVQTLLLLSVWYIHQYLVCSNHINFIIYH